MIMSLILQKKIALLNTKPFKTHKVLNKKKYNKIKSITAIKNSLNLMWIYKIIRNYKNIKTKISKKNKCQFKKYLDNFYRSKI